MVKIFENKLSFNLIKELKKFSKRLSDYGFNFAVYDGNLNIIFYNENNEYPSDEDLLKDLSKKLFSSASEYIYDENKRTYAIKLTVNDDNFSAIIDTGNRQINDKDFLKELLLIFSEKFHNEVKTECQIEKVSSELSHTYEELVLLHKIGTNMKVTESDANFLQMACDNLTDIVNVEGIAILLEKNIDEDSHLVLAAGAGIIDLDKNLKYILRTRLLDELNSKKEALLDSEIDTPFKYEWSNNIKSIIAVPLMGKDKRQESKDFYDENDIIGLMVAVNRQDKPDFDSTDVKLFNSVANGCAVFVENGKLFKDLKELFIGSLKALTNSIDAKDQYTRGHSERVAFISQWIAKKYAEVHPLKEQKIHKIYLAGLLHDIGKMGIDESVLRKKGRLTDEEFNHIRMHPCIGAGILNEIKQMKDIVPGILCHHERYDGKGYPNGIKGEELPLMGKIISLADSFDAMTSKRVYRNAMTVQQALEEIKKGLGTQFDPVIGRIFVESDIYGLWDVIQDGVCENSDVKGFSEYGTAAVGTLIR